MSDLVLAATHLAGSSGTGDLLVVGPSLGTSVTALWSACAHHLADRFEVVGWDLPGHGRASPARDFSVEDLAEAVVVLTDNLRRDARPCWYAGVSIGGAVGIELARRDRTFESVAAIASAANLGEPAGWRERAALVRGKGTSAVAELSSKRWFGPGFIERQPEVVARLLCSLADVEPESYAAACDALAGYDLRPGLGDVLLPLVLMPGSDDPVVSVAQAAGTADRAPGATLHPLERCGHLPPAERPRYVAAALLDFFVADSL